MRFWKILWKIGQINFKFMKIIIGSDHRGFNFKTEIINSLDFDFIDCGTNSLERCDYTNIVSGFIEKKQSLNIDFGILICGTGIGVSIMANRFKDIRAAICYNNEVAILSRQHNDANIACFGSYFMNIDVVKESILSFVKTEFLNVEPYLTRVDYLNNC